MPPAEQKRVSTNFAPSIDRRLSPNLFITKARLVGRNTSSWHSMYVVQMCSLGPMASRVAIDGAQHTPPTTITDPT